MHLGEFLSPSFVTCDPLVWCFRPKSRLNWIGTARDCCRVCPFTNHRGNTALNMYKINNLNSQRKEEFGFIKLGRYDLMIYILRGISVENIQLLFRIYIMCMKTNMQIGLDIFGFT